MQRIALDSSHLNRMHDGQHLTPFPREPGKKSPIDGFHPFAPGFWGLTIPPSVSRFDRRPVHCKSWLSRALEETWACGEFEKWKFTREDEVSFRAIRQLWSYF